MTTWNAIQLLAGVFITGGFIGFGLGILATVHG